VPQSRDGQSRKKSDAASFHPVSRMRAALRAYPVRASSLYSCSDFAGRSTHSV